MVRSGSPSPVLIAATPRSKRMDAARRKAIHDGMVRLADGDRSAFGVLVDELWPVILSFAERGVGKGPDAEDVAQEVFYRISARITDFDRTRDGLSWAFGIASFEIKTARQKRKRRREIYDDSTFASEADPAESQESLLLDRELVIAFEHAVGALTEDDRRALGLAAECEVPVVMSATVRKRKQRALDRLKNIWRSIHGES
jgi:RNA polymerase sigma-70 factor, ECF subfamily